MKGEKGMIKAIETQYRGYRFRSRLEARWAVFFDGLRIRWVYEPEGFDLGELGWYLPDFWLPEQDCWVEVKPDRNLVTEEECNKAFALSRMTGKLVFMLFQVEPYDMYLVPGGQGEVEFEGNNLYFAPNGDRDGLMSWGICSNCGRKQIGHFGSHHVTYKDVFDGVIAEGCDDINLENTDSPLLVNAYQLARSARFEHGETPKVMA